MGEYGLYEGARDLRDDYGAVFANVELPWVDLAPSHNPASLGHNFSDSTVTRYVRGVVETLQRCICNTCPRSYNLLGDAWGHLSPPPAANQVVGDYGEHVWHFLRSCNKPRPQF